MKELGKVMCYKISIKKSVEFLYTNNKLAEREIKKTIPLTTASRNKILRNTFNQGGKRPVL